MFLLRAVSGIVALGLFFSPLGSQAQAVPATSLASGQKAQSTKKTRTEPYANVTAVGVAHDKDGPAIEIISTRPLSPAIRELDSPHRLVIDLPKAILAVRLKRMEVQNYQINIIRVDQFQADPPITRVVVDLQGDVGYSWDSQGSRLLVRLKPIEDARRFSAPSQGPSVVGFSTGTQPVATPENPGASGAVLLASKRVGSGSTITAATDTTILRMAHGGEVRVCPGTTVSISASANGRDVMLGMSTGAMEAHYKLGASADSVVTPDFRILLSGPGEFHYAISVDTRGNTCVRALMGNTASAIVSELMGEGTYQIKSADQLVFHNGRLDKVDSDVPLECGCPPPSHPVQRASTATLPELPDAALNGPQRLATADGPAKVVNNPSSTPGLDVQSSTASNRPPPKANLSVIAPKVSIAEGGNSGQVHVAVEAPMVFRGTDTQPAPTQEAEALPPISTTRQAKLMTVELPEPTPGKSHASKRSQKRSLMGKVKGFFSNIFR
jgi:hypothetical protein